MNKNCKHHKSKMNNSKKNKSKKLKNIKAKIKMNKSVKLHKPTTNK